MNDIFRKELQKRNINSIDDIKEEESEPKRRGNVVPPPSFSNDAVNDPPPQLQRSRELNSEGLEGLIPRGSQLLQLGISFFLAFGPFILFVVISFTLLYGVCVNKISLCFGAQLYYDLYAFASFDIEIMLINNV